MGSPEKKIIEKGGIMRRKDKFSIAIIFKYADWIDIMLMLLGTIGAIGDGLSTNCLLVFVSRLMNSLGYSKTQQNHGNFMDGVEKVGTLVVNILIPVFFFPLSFSHIYSFWVLFLLIFFGFC
jgi:hypothetical protein